MRPRILGVATTNPPHRISQPEVRELVRVMFDRLSGLERLLTIFENTGIESRYISTPPQWFTQPRSFADKNQLWFETALQLSETACRKALTLAGVEPEQIGALVLVTTTGIATPGLEAYLLQRLGIPLGAVRLPIWGLGCAGGPAGLARAAEIAQSRPRQYVLLVCVELCSLTFVSGDLSKSNLVATSLFADGAAAVVVGMPDRANPAAGPLVRGGFSRLLPDSHQVMGWDLAPDGLQVRFAQSIPAIVEGELGSLIQGELAGYGLCTSDVRTWTLHPGGAKVLAAYRKGIGVDEKSLEASYCVLRQFGNMSSPTVFFVLARQMYQLERPEAGTTGVILALGPGFAAEGAVLRW